VTSPTAQAQLIRDLYEKAEIDPATISYIEAHGPGTRVGDPIEILGLQKAFVDLAGNFGSSLPEASCGIGSVKTNIGHLESAAGIAGIAKVLGAFRRRVLPRTLHFERLNPLINLKGSPFYIVDKTQPWVSESRPRRAGVSSFGFGGTNAHIVIEEFREVPTEPSGTPEIIPLSATDPERLKERIGNLQRFLQSSLARSEQPSLKRLAYTLQMGREDFGTRVAFSATSVDDLNSQLRDFNSENFSSAALPKSAREWINGASIDWDVVRKSPSPQRMSLPGYPFARERYWFKSGLSSKEKVEKSSDALLHPLLHKNISVPGKCSFSSVFDGNETFLKKHQISNTRH
jgi:polyketide synthase PksL